MIKEKAYKSLVLPILEYAQIVWDPYVDEQVKQLEAVQRRAARFTLNRYRRTSSVSAMITELDWPLLADRRKAARLHMFYKIENNLVSTSMPLQSKQRQEPTRCYNTHSYIIPTSRTDYHKQSFFYRTAREWNCLPETTVQACSLDSFKTHLQKP